ncbi:hypothetical protein D3C87_1751280 [compost metagenome]
MARSVAAPAGTCSFKTPFPVHPITVRILCETPVPLRDFVQPVLAPLKTMSAAVIDTKSAPVKSICQVKLVAEFPAAVDVKVSAIVGATLSIVTEAVELLIAERFPAASTTTPAFTLIARFPEG